MAVEPAPVAARGVVRYTLRVPSERAAPIAVRACAEGFRPDRWIALRGASPGLVRASGTPGCVDYEVGGRAHDGAFGGSPTALLRAPRPMPEALEVRIRLDVPEGYQVAVPWRREGDEYRPATSIVQRQGHMAFGPRLDVRPLPARTIDAIFATPAGTFRGREAEAAEALGEVVDSVVRYAGYTPPTPLLAMASATGDDDGVRFGHVMRGGGPSLWLLVGGATTPETLRRDWVPTHELSHWLLPRFENDDAWIYEGFATYLQIVIRARRGVISEHEALEELEAGLGRGRVSGSAIPLVEECRTMQRTGAYHRVYWSGTVFWWALDVWLAQQGRSLDEVIAQHGEALSRRGPARDGVAFMRAWLAELGAPLDADAWAARTDFPDVAELEAAMGLDGTFRLDASGAELRARIFGGG